MSQNIKKSYRDKLLAGGERKGKTFTVEDMELVIKPITRREKREIISLATEKNGNVNLGLVETWATIKLTLIKETNERVFDDEDFDTIDNMGLGGVFDEVSSEAFTVVLGVETDPKELPKD